MTKEYKTHTIGIQSKQIKRLGQLLHNFESMNAKRKPDPKDPNYSAYIAEKQRILLTNAKRSIPDLKKEDDPFGDRDLFDREVTRFFVCQGAKIEFDPNAKGKYRHIVKTSVFGGCAKHLDSIEVESFRNVLHHSKK